MVDGVGESLLGGGAWWGWRLVSSWKVVVDWGWCEMNLIILDYPSWWLMNLIVLKNICEVISWLFLKIYVKWMKWMKWTEEHHEVKNYKLPSYLKLIAHEDSHQINMKVDDKLNKCCWVAKIFLIFTCCELWVVKKYSRLMTCLP